MREIKFRGKSSADSFEASDDLVVNPGDWIYGNLIVDGRQAYIVNGVVECTGEYIALGDWCPVDIGTVGQYTVLLDKNGKEIYEGDIIYDGGRKLLVEFKAGHWFAGGSFLSTVARECEVIGDIHQNPEMLKEDI